MATFSKRVTASGEVTHQAKCRRKGLPTQSKTFKSLTDAKKWARQIERAFDTGEGLVAPVQSDSTLGDILKRYREEVCPMLRGGDLEAQRINIWLREWPFTKTLISELSPSVLATYRDERLRQVSAGTVLRELNILRAALNRARIDWGVPVPDVQIKRPKAPAPRDRRLKSGEEELLLKGCDGSRIKQRKPVIILAIETAARQGELLALTWDNVDRRGERPGFRSQRTAIHGPSRYRTAQLKSWRRFRAMATTCSARSARTGAASSTPSFG